MNILAVDTATGSCSVAFLKDRRLIAEEVYTAGKTHSRHLMAIIDHILDRCEIAPADLDGIAVTRGPGTFTGLRIGLSTVKGLAAAIAKPVVGVSSLAALAFPLAWTRKPVVAMIDARRGEIYHARFSGGNGSEPSGKERVSGPQEAAKTLPEGAVLAGSGAVLYREVWESRRPDIRLAPETAHVIRAASVGMLAMHRFENQAADPADVLVPKYIRKSDAQIHMASC
ncbi:tRNA (adenosine(37)-N6)-threonylcarbamoyltransferase complex dimerization subunit type 1 TsaB [Desulfosarcina widdelii]|uniref:tRNA (Adenosine(37)-N6)-threonylcarbamoyltransferase complex dimerization subunit type 1 TsaB n=1 Tax=Desulfosarcina widdelii TaxID=947919 RepID=A0A5K7YZG2_9BACT|nr:tRNA (adenosine(37)-N6)-threonylcarbamoyltransferase complex dimerization subunit type 1 TsaB [Desulfosarcina widdelii]BBO73780.1 tRNA (adenosine(37)-N6)-threonylcarbamoyltransferase complex dimerization subunit type 1 TsaB [Desulfosarcina widdelii]